MTKQTVTVTETEIDETETETDGTKEKKGPSLLQILHQEWLAKGGKMPSKKEGNELVRRLNEEKKAIDAAEEAVKLARESFAAVSRECIEAFGTGMNLPIGGVPHAPMARSGRVYYRKLGSQNLWQG